jgi:hypothetical protein
MFDSFPAGAHETLKRPAYHEEFARYLKEVSSQDKLERGQHFKERGFPSWEAFAEGNWESAVALAGERRDRYAEEIENARRRGTVLRRLRVVEFPVTPYVQWEMFVLRVRVEVGDQIRVLDARTITDIEEHHLVPEVVVLGSAVMFEVVYDDDGNAAGARRYLDPSLIEETKSGFDELYERGEDFLTFFDREIAPLGPPAVSHA